MKLIISGLMLLMSTSSFAGGKVIAQGTHSFTTDRDFISLIGLSIYEPLFKSKFLFVDSFFAKAMNEYGEDASLHRGAYIAKVMPGVRLGNLELGLGYNFIMAEPSNSKEHRAVARIALKLW